MLELCTPDADIYLFDDPLAAVDLTVAEQIFRQCISNEGILNNKTRLLVTHQIQFLPEFDHCILLDRGTIEKQGLFDDLLTIEKVKHSYENQQYHTSETRKKKQRRDSYVYDSIKSAKTVDGK